MWIIYFTCVQLVSSTFINSHCVVKIMITFERNFIFSRITLYMFVIVCVSSANFGKKTR